MAMLHDDRLLPGQLRGFFENAARRENGKGFMILIEHCLVDELMITQDQTTIYGKGGQTITEAVMAASYVPTTDISSIKFYDYAESWEAQDKNQAAKKEQVAEVFAAIEARRPKKPAHGPVRGLIARVFGI